MSKIIHVNSLTKVYNAHKNAKEVKALDGINFSAESGEFIGIMGASGSGKTTLLNLLSGVDNATSGQIAIDGKEISTMKKDELALFRRRKIGYIFQDFNLLDSLTLSENVALPLTLDRVAPKIVTQKVNELLAFFSIEDIGNKYPYHISGGQKQRVAAARALINEPAICFADEPTGNLDSKSSANIMAMLADMNNIKKSTILMVTHDAFAASYCKRIIFIKDGKINLEIFSNGDRKAFFDKILEVQSMTGGEA